MKIHGGEGKIIYQYAAYNKNGEVVKGRLPATSEESATELLGYAGYQVIHLKLRTEFLSLDKLLLHLFPVKPAEIILFYRQLALLLESGVDIVTSLELLQSQASKRALKRVLDEVISDLRGGTQLSAALSKHPKIFSPICCQSLRVGEHSGGLEIMLRQVADYIEKEAAAAKGVKNAMMYPVMASIFTIIVIGVLVTFVLPAFGKLYSMLGAELPLATRILIDIANKLQSYGIYLLLAILIGVGSALVYTKTPNGRYKLDKLILRLPLIGRVNHLKELARYCRSISLLFHAGLPLTEIMTLITQGNGNSVLVKALTNVRQDMLKGEGLSQPLAKNSFFLPMMVRMVRVGEETGKLDTTLLAVAQSYEAEAEDRIRSLTALIQPALTIIVGLIICFIALSLTSAMYSIYGQGF